MQPSKFDYGYGRTQRQETSNDEITNTLIEKYCVSRVELSFKDQFVSRRDMWKITQMLNLQSVYKHKKFNINDIRCRVRALFDENGKEINNGLIDVKRVKFSFFSKSPQSQILIEVSSDMYKFDHNGHMQTEKAVSFVKSYFERCIKDYSCTNEVTIVLYSRLFYP